MTIGPDWQTMFNIAASIISLLLGWVITGVRSAIRDQQRLSAEIAAKVQAIEVLVAGSYVKRDDMDKLTSALFAKLDRIETKVDLKVNREECAGCHK